MNRKMFESWTKQKSSVFYACPKKAATKNPSDKINKTKNIIDELRPISH